MAAGYGRGVQELWSRRGAGHVVPRWRVAAFGAGLLVVLGTEHGPAHEMAESSLAGHMAQHMLLLLVAGPLLAAGAAGLPLSMAVPLPLRRLLARCRVAPPIRRLRHPGTYALLAGGGQTVVLWFWHLPGPYAAAVDRPAVHATEHLCFLVTAWLFWAPVLGSPRHRAPAPVTVLLLAGTMLPASALGAVLTFAPQPIYPAAGVRRRPAGRPATRRPVDVGADGPGRAGRGADRVPGLAAADGPRPARRPARGAATRRDPPDGDHS